jgi:hypothetical protein
MTFPCHTLSKFFVSTHDGLQDADGADAISTPGRRGGGIAAADGDRSETSEPVIGGGGGGGA